MSIAVKILIAAVGCWRFTPEQKAYAENVRPCSSVKKIRSEGKLLDVELRILHPAVKQRLCVVKGEQESVGNVVSITHGNDLLRGLFLRLIDPAKYKQLTKDFQVGWFWKIFLRMVYVNPPGRVPYDDDLWKKIAGARSRQNWETYSGPVMNCFSRQTIENTEWLVHDGLTSFIEEQKCASEVKQTKDSYTISTSENEPLGILFNSFYKNYPRKIQKKEAKKRFFRESKEHSNENKCPILDSAEFITNKSAEYGAVMTPAIKRGDIMKKHIPYPATWLHRGGYMDDPTEWVANAKVSLNGEKREGFISKDQQRNTASYQAVLSYFSGKGSGGNSSPDGPAAPDADNHGHD